MDARQQAVGAEMRWVKPRWTKRQFELVANGGAVATLAFTRGSQAVGQMAGEQYRFSRKGFIRQRIVVRSEDGAGLLGLLTQRGTSGTLSVLDGLTFTWKKPTFWTTEHVWQDAMGTELIRFRPSSWHPEVNVTVAPEAAQLRELPLLLLLGEYLAVLAAEDESAATIAATAGA